jgi:hypothetical protein
MASKLHLVKLENLPHGGVTPSVTHMHVNLRMRSLGPKSLQTFRLGKRRLNI